MQGGNATKRARTPATEKKPDGQGTALQSQIAQRAYELYEERGSEPGRELEDWLTAEQEVLGAQMDADLGD